MGINTNYVVWKPICSAPWGKEVLLTGLSGYCKPHDKFVISGYREKGWHNDEFNDPTGTPLSDAGWVPLYWGYKPVLPDMK